MSHDRRQPGRSEDDQILGAAARRHRAALVEAHALLLRWNAWQGELAAHFEAYAQANEAATKTLRSQAQQLYADYTRTAALLAEVEKVLHPTRPHS